MATLFQRVIGDIDENESRIPIHGIRAMFGEIERGALEPVDIITQYELDVVQQSDLISLLSSMATVADTGGFSRFMFDWLALAELGLAAYRDEAAFWARVAAEAA